MNIAHIEPYSFIYGPGCRTVIWTQGCSVQCKGCWNTDMWSFEPKNLFSADELLSQILKNTPDIEDITLLGGEPLDQYPEILELCQKAQQNGLSVMLFTGYEMHEIHEKNMQNILPYLDILITGRYDLTKRTLEHQWIGSTNQKIHFLTEKYLNYPINNQNYVEIHLNENGSANILGFPYKNLAIFQILK
ncbi:MAG: hypothetical protein OHK0038_26960 [Flammeovirgaceae bacterium]